MVEAMRGDRRVVEMSRIESSLGRYAAEKKAEVGALSLARFLLGVRAGEGSKHQWDMGTSH